MSEKTHSIYIIENGNIEPELKINLSQDLKKAAFDMKALKEQGDLFQGLAIVENCDSHVQTDINVQILLQVFY